MDNIDTEACSGHCGDIYDHAVDTEGGYILWTKKVGHRVFVITPSDIDQFSKFFHSFTGTVQEICNKAMNKDSTTPQSIATLPCKI